MNKNIEVEQRGPLTKKQFLALNAYLRKKAKFKGFKERILIDYSTFIASEGIKNRKRDIRLRTTNGIPEIMIKLGRWGGSENRKELSLIAQKGEFDKLVQIFGALGLTKGALVITKTNVYMYKGIDFAVVDVCGKKYIFEAELMVKSSKKINQAKEKIDKVIGDLGLRIYSNEEFYQYIEDLNKKNIAKFFKFEDYKEGYFKKRFKV